MNLTLCSLRRAPHRNAITPRAKSFAGAVVGLAVLATAQNAEAYKNGTMTTVCSDCHGNGAATVEVRFDPEVMQPGETTRLVIAVSGNNLAGAGIAVRAPVVGQFSVPSTEPIRLQDGWAMHSSPKASSDGVVEFLLDWTAPSEPGVATFEVAAVAANLDNARSGDRTAKSTVSIAYGCEAATLYWDADGDGVGRSDSSIVFCGEKDRYSTLSGDCNDDNDSIYPGGPELCNELDDDCDGDVDDNCGVPSTDTTAAALGSTTQTAPTSAATVVSGPTTDGSSLSSSPPVAPDSSEEMSTASTATAQSTMTVARSTREMLTTETTNTGVASELDASDAVKTEDSDAPSVQGAEPSRPEGCTCRVPRRPPRGMARWAVPLLGGVMLLRRRLRSNRDVGG